MSSAMGSFTLEVLGKIRINEGEVNGWHEFKINFHRIRVLINLASRNEDSMSLIQS